MSMKIYDKESGQWKKQSTMLSSSIKVLDAEGKFKDENSSVERCLSELKDDISDLKDDVKYIYENGPIGDNRPPGGGSVLPVVTITSPSVNPVYVTSKETVTIEFSFTSPNRGGGTAQIICAGKVTKMQVSMNETYSVKVGPFKRNASGYKAVISVVDSQGFGSVPEELLIISGAIDISSTFNRNQEFTMQDDIMFPLMVEADTSEALNLECYFRNAPHPTLHNTPVKKGMNDLHVGRLPAMGVSKIRFKVTSEKYASGELSYSLIASDSTHLYISSDFEPTFTWKHDIDLNIDYRLSKKGEYKYRTNYYIDDMTKPAFEGIMSNPSPNINYWKLGTTLSVGQHVLKIESTTLDGQNTASLTFNVTITSDGFDPHSATPNPIAYFNASGKQNSGISKTVWRSEVGNMICNLYGFNYETNGFFDGDLKFEGKSYAVIDYAPFAQGLKDSGFTFEITYKARNTGDNDARVVHCFNENNKQGFYIDTEDATFQTKSGSLAICGYEPDQYITKTFVVDPTYKVTAQNPAWETDPTQNRWLDPAPNGVIKIFTNASITAVDYFDTSDGFDFKNLFKYDGKIILGARCNDTPNGQDLSTADNFGSCEIKSIRIYDRFLTDVEVLDNYISLQDEQEQRRLLRINDLRTGDFPYAGIATVDILDDLSSLEEGREIDTMVSITDYHDSKNSINVPAAVSWQGTSSKDYPVKNYTIKMYAGSGGNKIPLVTYAPDPKWLPEYRWTLKANYMDSSQANNVGTAKFIHNFTTGKYGNIYPQQQLNSKTRNCVDGIPVRLRINDENFGVYTFNIDRYAHQNYGLSTYEQLYGANQEVIGANILNHSNAVSYEIAGNNTASSGFNTSNFDNIKNEFKHRFNYREKEGVGAYRVTVDEIGEDGAITTRLSNEGDHSELMDLMRWMDTVTDEDFWLHARDHFSIPHLIDYYLICQLLGMVDSLGKNMVLTTFGPAKDTHGNLLTIWYPSFYDCDTIMGLNNTGQIDVSSGIEMSEYVQKDSKLWRLLTKSHPNNPFPTMISKRYTDLRRNVISNGQVTEYAPFAFESIIKFYENNLINSIGQKFYNEDAESKYIKKKMYLHMCSGSRLSFTRRWLRERLLFLDSHYESTEYSSNRIALRSNKVIENGIIRIKTYSPQKIKIQFQDGAEPLKLRCDRKGWTTFKTNISNIENNNTTIFGADNIMEIEGLKELNISFLDIQNARKLTKLDVAGNKRLTSIVMNNNRYLRTLDIQGCTGMGTDTKVQRIDLRNCNSIRKINVSNTSLQGIDFNTVGGYIDYLNISNTQIRALSLIGQSYLTEIIANNNDKMTSFYMKKCNSMPKIEIVNSKLDTFLVEDCESLREVNISGTAYLSSIKTILCDNLTKLNLSRVTGPGVRHLDLTTLLQLTDLNISHSSVKHIKFGQYTEQVNGEPVLKDYNKLVILNADGSALVSIGFGVNAQFSDDDRLDLASLPNLTNVNFSQCRSIKYVDNINVNGYTSFHQCGNLIEVNGTLTLRGSIDSIFYGCSNLMKLPTFDLREVTSMTHTFYACPKLTMAQAKTIMSKVSSNLRTANGTFRACSNLKGQIPDGFFSKCTNVTTIDEFFWDCSGITGGINTLLTPMGNTLLSMTDTFKGTKISECPTVESFAPLKVIKSMIRTFSNTDINSVPNANLFTQQKKTKTLTSLHATFNGCTKMVGTIPETLFHGLDNLSDISYFFQSTKVYGNIPSKIFDIKSGQPNSLTRIAYFFHDCREIDGKIPPLLFSYSPSLSGVEYCFSGTKINGIIPENLFEKNNNLTNTSYLFAGCSQLGKGLENGQICTIPKKLFSKKTKLQRADYMFKDCPGIVGKIEDGTFDDCRSLAYVEGMFMNCTGLTGQLPVRISTWRKEPHPDFPDLFPEMSIDVEYVDKYGLFDNAKIVTARRLFYGCQNLVSTIPYSLLYGATDSLTDASEMFYMCYRITGKVPKELFSKCRKLKTVAGCFQYCRTLNNPDAYDPDAEELVRYIIDPDTFANNPELENVNNLFYMWQQYPPAQVPLQLSGAMPPGLFRNNTALRYASGLFNHVSGLTGKLDTTTFNNCINLESVNCAFQATGLNTIDRELFLTCNRPIDFYWAFRDMGSVTSKTFDYDRLKRTPSNRTGCFANSSFSNKSTIPNEWK